MSEDWEAREVEGEVLLMSCCPAGEEAVRCLVLRARHAEAERDFFRRRMEVAAVINGRIESLEAQLAEAREKSDRTRIEVHTEKRLKEYRDRCYRAEDEAMRLREALEGLADPDPEMPGSASFYAQEALKRIAKA